MDKLVFDLLEMLFAGSMVSDVYDFLKMLMDGLSKVFNDASVSQYFTIFTAAAASLLIVFFFMDMASNATRDMLTLERLVLSFIKLALGVILLMFLPEILNGLFALVQAVYNEIAKIDVKNAKIEGMTFWGYKTFPEWEKVADKDIIDSADGIIKQIAGNLNAVFMCGIGTIIGMLANMAAYLFAITNAISLVARAIFSPLAVCQCFEDGQRSAGIQYLKKFAADGLALAVMIGLLFAASVLQGNITGALVANTLKTTEITAANAMEVASNIPLVVTALAINLSCVGAIMKSNQLAQDIVGAH